MTCRGPLAQIVRLLQRSSDNPAKREFHARKKKRVEEPSLVESRTKC